MSNPFFITIDPTKIKGLADKLAGLTPEQLGALTVAALNEATDNVYELARQRIRASVNLTDEYVKRKMTVVHATPQKMTATITASGAKPDITSLSHYGAMQDTNPVNWTNQRIAAMGKFRSWRGKNGSAWPGWTERTGSEPLGIAVNEKAAGKSVEVKPGSRKTRAVAFSIPGKLDNDRNLLIFQRTAANKLKVLAGPSVYQLFRAAAIVIEPEAENQLMTNLSEMADKALRNALP